MSNHLKKKIEEHIRGANPDLVEQIEKSGQLETYLTQRASETAQLIMKMEEELLKKSPAPPEYLERLRHLEMLKREAEEIALSQMTSSPPPMPDL